MAQYLCEWARADELKALPISVGPINAFEPDLLHLAAKVLVQLLALPTGADGGYPRVPLEPPRPGRKPRCRRIEYRRMRPRLY